VGKKQIVAVLLSAEYELRQRTRVIVQSGQKIDPDQPLYWSDVASTSKFTDVVELQFNLQKIIDQLKSRIELPIQFDRTFYAIRELSNGDRSLTNVSEWLAALIRACDGTRTIEEVVTQLSFDILDVDDEFKSYVFLKLIQEAQTQGILSIYRTDAAEIGPLERY
jgi:hypothetical protein